MRIIPVLFATDMVRALLEDRKSVTRRVIRGAATSWSFQGMERDPAVFHVRADGEACPKTVKGLYATFEADPGAWYPILKAPYEPGDILYVREKFRLVDFNFIDGDWSANVQYRADMAVEERLHYLKHGEDERFGWRPSIHMPKEAARIFLRVKAVWVERLQEITEDGAVAEGILPKGGNFAIDDFESLWDSTLKPVDRDKYGWDANPWVWVIEFGRTGKPEGWPGEAE